MAFNTTPIGFAYADMELNGSIMVNVPTAGAAGIGVGAGVDSQRRCSLPELFRQAAI